VGTRGRRGECAPAGYDNSFDPRPRRAWAHKTSQVTSHRATLVYNRGSEHRGMRTIVRVCCWVRRRMCLSAPCSAGFSGCAGWGSCWVTPGRKAYGPVANVWVSSLARVRVSLGSHTLCIRASRQKLTRIYPTRMRAKLYFGIRRVPLAWIVLKRTIHSTPLTGRAVKPQRQGHKAYYPFQCYQNDGP